MRAELQQAGAYKTPFIGAGCDQLRKDPFLTIASPGLKHVRCDIADSVRVLVVHQLCADNAAEVPIEPRHVQLLG